MRTLILFGACLLVGCDQRGEFEDVCAHLGKVGDRELGSRTGEVQRAVFSDCVEGLVRVRKLAVDAGAWAERDLKKQISCIKAAQTVAEVRYCYGSPPEADALAGFASDQ